MPSAGLADRRSTGALVPTRPRCQPFSGNKVASALSALVCIRFRDNLPAAAGGKRAPQKCGLTRQALDLNQCGTLACDESRLDKHPGTLLKDDRAGGEKEHRAWITGVSSRQPLVGCGTRGATGSSPIWNASPAVFHMPFGILRKASAMS